MDNQYLTANQAKSEFRKGLLTGFCVAFHDMDGSWLVSFEVSYQHYPLLLVDAHKKEVRRFRTLDAAVSAVRAVGFKAPMLKGNG